MTSTRSEHAGAAAARGVVFNLGGQLVPLLIAVVAMPIVMRGLGPARFGVLALAWILLGYFGLLDFGLSRALTKYAAETIGRADHARTNALAWTTLLLQLLFGIALSLTLYALAPSIPLFLRMNATSATETTTVFRFIALALPFVLLFNTTRALLEAGQRFGTVNAIRMTAGSLNFLIPLIGVLAHSSLPAIVLAIVVARALAALVQMALCARLLQHPVFSRAEAATLLRFGGAVTISSVVSPILVYLDRFALGRLVSMTAVGYYSAPSEIVTRVLVVPGSFAQALYPLLSRADDASARAARAMVQGSLKFIWLLLAPAIALAIVYADAVLRVWAGPELALHSAHALRILLAGILICSLAQLPLTELHARGRPDVPAKLLVAELVCYVPLLWLCIRSWGITGAAAAWSMRVTADALLLFVAARLVGGRGHVIRLGRQVWEPLLMLLVLGGALAVSHALRAGQAWEWSAAGLLVAAWLVITWRRMFEPADRQLLRLVTGTKKRRNEGTKERRNEETKERRNEETNLGEVGN